ncbi:tyrosine-type recombinase/integrase [Pontitalea aquivivens]|uniref:tyrosine-type recombinase/integrase n=1 Tax=Pontitalea aquivivens TaxID=3388663 RepID=UPI003970D805
MAGKKLTAKAVEGNLKPGYHSDGTVPGLYLAVGASGSRSWVLRYVPPALAGTITTRAAGATAGRNKPRAMGLGPFPAISLAVARERARAERTKIAEGIDPLEERKREKSAVRIMTFAEAASAFIAAKVDVKEGGFKNAKHRQQWRNTLETYANPIIGKFNVAHIDTDLVLKVLQQDVQDKSGEVVGNLWNKKNETAMRLRGRMENILDWATFRGLRPKGENPARWKGHLDVELTPPKDLQVTKHHAALPYPEIGAFMAELRGRDAPAARALEFSILTATRSSETRLAVWAEFDLKNRLWAIPAERMKKGKEHEIPLTDEMIALLEGLPREEDNPFVFVGTSRNGGMSENALNNVLNRMGRADLTQHGFRSTFREWAGEMTAYPREVIEHALAHSLKDKAEAAYQRGTLLPKRRKLMADWSKYCSVVQPKDGENVVPMRGAV